jgi:site-specific recombinase XerD
MLEMYFVKPQTVDRIRALWIGPEIERYVAWLADRGYGARSVWRRVPLVAAFGEFARLKGARSLADLPGHVDAFVDKRVGESRDARRGVGPTLAKDIRGPVEQLLELVVPGFEPTGRPHHRVPFASAVPGFFEYLVAERGLRPASVASYRHHLDRFEAYLQRAGVAGLGELSPVLLSAFVAERSGAGLAKTTVREGCGVLRVFLRYAHREGLVRGDLWKTVEWPQAYRLSAIPRSISWDDVGKVLAAVDRRTPCGKRDYAILLLLVTYGLRSREVAALTLDDIDWRRERLAVPERKAGHSTAFPLSGSAGEALADYLRHGRPESPDRHVFFRAVAPLRPIGADAVSGCARRYLLRAGINVPRPGSHTLRHSAVQRLVDAGFSLKTIGDYAGHRSAASTEIYAKVAVESLRQVALGDGEEVLQ